MLATSKALLTYDELDPDTIDRVNQSAYDAIAGEYDDSAHTTTRLLESASCTAFRQFASAATLLPTHVLEIGCGTGNLTKLLADLHMLVDACDLSARMLQIAAGKMGTRSVRFHRESVFRLELSASCVAAGLADPYLVPAAVTAIQRALKPKGLLFLTIPEYTWALSERRGRLHVPLQATRFRRSDGGYAIPFSFVYRPAELQALLGDTGFDIVGMWEESADVELLHSLQTEETRAIPKVLCVSARKR